VPIYPDINLQPLGDRGILVEFANEITPKTNQKVRRMDWALGEAAIPGIIESVPAYRSLLVIYDPLLISFEALQPKLRSLAEALEPKALPEPRVMRIPVVYGGPYGPDLGFVSEYCHISPEDVVRLHCSKP